MAVTDDGGMKPGLLVLPRPKEPCAFRGTSPFVQIARVVGRTHFGHVERHHARRMRSIDQRFDSSSLQGAHDPFDGEDQRRMTGDVVDHRQARPRCHCFQDGLEDLVGAL